jgi:hypothetical protein
MASKCHNTPSGLRKSVLPILVLFHPFGIASRYHEGMIVLNPSAYFRTKELQYPFGIVNSIIPKGWYDSK